MSRNGSDVLLLVNTGTPLVPVYEAMASQRSATFDEKVDEVNYSSKDVAAFRGGPGRYKATISGDSLYVPDDDSYLALRSALRNREMILVAREVDAVPVETADAFMTSLSEKFPDQAESTISFSLTVDGEWTEVGT